MTKIGYLDKLKGKTTISENEKLARLLHVNFYLIKVIFLVKLSLLVVNLYI